MSEDAHDSNNYYRPETLGEKFDRLAIERVHLLEYPAHDHITAVSTPQSSAGNALETIGCIHCHAAYGHKISCPVFYSHAVLPQTTTPLTDDDIKLLEGLKIARF